MASGFKEKVCQRVFRFVSIAQLKYISESIMKRVSLSEKKLGFNIHALVFVPSMALLLAINLWKGSPYWIMWVLLGWGAGLLAHWWFVLGPGASKVGAR
jgi:hypothetical protein